MGGGFFDEFGLGGLRFGEVEAGDLGFVARWCWALVPPDGVLSGAKSSEEKG